MFGIKTKPPLSRKYVQSQIIKKILLSYCKKESKVFSIVIVKKVKLVSLYFSKVSHYISKHYILII